MIDFQISVIIPVYNAARYVRQAVESALSQPEVAEVVLVEDASPDHSLFVCQSLVNENDKVKLFQHPGGANRGAGPSRNLGIQKSTSPYIAFLDADDFYLPGRFSIPAEIFNNNPNCDGVYEALGIHFEDQAGEARWLSSNMSQVRLTTMNAVVAPHDLFRVLMKGGSGHIHLNALVINRSILDRSGLMDETIADTLHEDIDFVLRLAAVGNLYPGRIDQPTSMRRVHAENRVSAPRSQESISRDQMRLRMATYRWCRKERLKTCRELSFKRMLNDRLKMNSENRKLKGKTLFAHKALLLLTWPFENAEVLLEKFFWMEFTRSIWGIINNRG